MRRSTRGWAAAGAALAFLGCGAPQDDLPPAPASGGSSADASEAGPSAPDGSSGPGSTAPGEGGTAPSGGSEESGSEAGTGPDPTDTGDDGTGISPDYPGDIGIDGHPSVIFFEDFEDGDVASMAEGWDSASVPEAMSLTADVPAGAVAGSQSLLMSVDTNNGVTLYENIPDQHADVYVRYYARYNNRSAYHHSGMWVGGYNPPTQWPQGNAGLLPSGADFFNNTFEPAGSDGGLRFDQYVYWPGMQCLAAPDQCWGNNMLGAERPSIPADAWACFELMMGMNTPGSADGSFAIWVDDELVQRVEPGTPMSSNGVGGWEPDAAGQAFEGFNWRSSPDFGMNWVWLDFYTDGPSSMSWDQVVVATERIGCMAPA